MATEKILNTRYQLKVDTTAHWALATNFIPKKGEPIIYQDINETDNTQKIKIKIGDGTTSVINLPFTLEPIKKFTVSATSANSYTGVSFEEIAKAVAQQGTCFCELEDLSLILPLVQIEAGSFKFNLVHNQTEYTLVSYFDEEILTLNVSNLGSSNSTNYGVCTTTAATAEKTVEIEGFELKKGVSIAIKFTFAVPANATLNISSTGAKNIYYKGTNIVSDIIQAGDLATFMYDGTQYHLLTIDRLTDNIKALEAKTQYFTPSTSEPNQLWFIGKSFAPSTDVEEVDLGSNSYRWNKLFLGGSTYSGIDTGSNLITRSELNCLSGINTNIQDAIDNLNTIGNQFTLYTDENRLAFTGQNFTPLNTSKLSNLGDNYNYWNYIFLQGGIYTPSGLIEARNIDQLANLQENVQNKLILLTQGYNELANKIENGTGGGSSSTTAPKVMSIFKPFDTASSTLPYNVAYGQIGFDETSLTPWVYAPYYTYYVTWNGMYLQQTGENMETVNNSTMPDMLSRGYNYLVDDSTDSVYSIFSPGSTSNTMPNTGTLPNTGTVGTIATGEEMSGDLSIYYNASNLRWYPTSGWDTSFLNTNTTYKLCMMEWQPFLQPAESSLF